MNQTNPASTLTYQVRSNEELCEGNGQRRQQLCFFQEKFLYINMEKLKAGIFDGPQTRELMKDSMFDEALSEAELFT